MQMQINTIKAAMLQGSILVQDFYLQMEASEKLPIFSRSDMRSFLHINNKGKNTLILKLTTKAIYPTNFTQQIKYLFTPTL